MHVTAVLALFTIRFPPGVPNFSPSRQHIVLIAPALAPPPAIVRPRFTPRPAPPTRAVSRFFQAPAALPAPAPLKIAVELPPAIETPRPLLAVPELTRLPEAPPPPLKTNNLIAALPEVPTPSPKLAVQAAGFSSAESLAPRGNTAGFRSVGSFGSAAAEEPERLRLASAVSKGGFGDASVASASSLPRAVSAPAAVTPVEILFKPRPLYSPEARRLQIEGEVLVELLFAASGGARVLRVVRGLGHGLDENAIGAAQAIRFRPAQRGGAPIDSTATVHIIFQLAY